MSAFDYGRSTVQLAKQLKLMAEYECWPLWVRESELKISDNIHPAELPLDADTVQRLLNWAAAFDSTLNQDDPMSSGFPNPGACRAFEEEGERLWIQLRNHLQPDYEVRFQKSSSGEELADPEFGRH